MTKRSDSGLPRVRYTTGDVFLVPLPHEHYAYGRILLALNGVRRAGLFKGSSNDLGGPFYGGSVLLQIYRVLFDRLPEPELLSSSALSFPSEFTAHDAIYRGHHPVVAHFPVNPEDIDFPEFVSVIDTGRSTRYYFQKGGLAIDLGPNREVGHRIQTRELPVPALRLGIASSLLLPALQSGVTDSYYPAPAWDLRQRPEQRTFVLSLAGLSPTQTYDAMCLACSRPEVTSEALLATCRPGPPNPGMQRTRCARR